MLKIFTVIILLATLIEHSLADSSCGDWKSYKDEKCFKFFDNSLVSESDAENVCQTKGNDSVLAIIKTKAEQEFINSFIKDSKIEDNVWIGIKKSSNTLKWLDGTEVEFTNWAKDRPLKTAQDLNCVEISVDQATFGKWIDDKCGKRNSILCQKIKPWSVERLQKIVLDTKRELTEVKQKLNQIESNPVPIGFIYAQLAGQSEPKTLWPNTEWENITSKYAGLFFRAEGGQSLAFGQTQEQQTQSLKFYSDYDVWSQQGPTGHWQTWVTVTDKMNAHQLLTGGNGGDRYEGINFYHGTEEIRPRNQAIRIWRRIK